MRNIALVCIITLFIGCEKEEIDNPKKTYGLSYPSFNPVQSTEPDSIVELDISTGQYRSVLPASKYEGLDRSQVYVSSDNLNLLIYNIGSFDIGFIDLETGGFDRISFRDDTTHFGIGTFEVDERTNTLMTVCTYLDPETHEYVLGVDEIDLRSLEITKSYKLGKKSNERALLSAINSDTKNLYIVSPFAETLYIFDYSTGVLTIQDIGIRFEDVHYYKDQLIGTSNFNLVSYSLDNSSTTTIGKYHNLNAILFDNYFFDKENKDYWIGTTDPDDIRIVTMLNINLEDASIKKRVRLSKSILKLN